MHLYSQEIIERSRDNRGNGTLEQPTHQGISHNLLCGDRVHWTLEVQCGMIIQAKYQTKGCALCKASSSFLWEQIQLQHIDHVKQQIPVFCNVIDNMSKGIDIQKEEIYVFRDIRYAPLRKNCICLPWDGLFQILEQK